MTNEQKKQIEALRYQQLGYRTIAKILDMNFESVKAYCRYHNLQAANITTCDNCLNCGKKLTQVKGRKQKKFCCDACRMAWWSDHREVIVFQERNHKICEFCGGDYYSNKKTSRFCSCKCYADFRRLGGKSNAKETNHSQEGNELQTVKKTEFIDERTDSQRAEIPSLPSHTMCDKCPWFIVGQGLVEAYKLLSKAVQTDNCEPLDKEKK